MKNIATIIVFFHLALLTFGQSPQKETYLGGFRLTDAHFTPQNGYLVAGFVKDDSVQLRRYNAAQTLERIITLNLRDSLFFVEEIHSVEALQMPDGTFIVATSILDCDIIVQSLLTKVDALGQMIWNKRINLVAHHLEYNTDSTFLIHTLSNSHIFHTNGTDITPVNMPVWSLQTIPLPDGRFLQTKDLEVRFTNQWNQPVGLPWFAPEPILAIDTLSENAGFVAFSETVAYRLNAQLQLTAITAIPVELQDRDIHTCPEGFITLRVESNKLYLRTYTPDFTLLSSVDLGKNLNFEIFPSPFFYPNRVKNSFVVHNGQFTLTLAHEAPTDWTKFWLVSDSTGVNRSWLSHTDLAVTDITLSATPTGNSYQVTSPFGVVSTLYNADFKNVFVRVKNEGTTTINHCKVLYFAPNECYDIPGCGGTLPNAYTISFDQLQLAPGQDTVLPLGPMRAQCVPYNPANFCLHVTEINHVRDSVESNNIFCKQLPITYVSTKEPIVSAFEISPNPAHDWVQIRAKSDKNNLEIAQINLLSPIGATLRQLSVTPGDQIQIPVHDLPTGLYFLQIWTADQQTGTQPIVISR
jgi:hypothetical protein